VRAVKESAFASAVGLIEDALALAKRADSNAWLIYLAGAVPFFGLLLFEITDLAQNPFALERLPLIALLLALLYCWLHVCQSVFCGCLQAALTETGHSLGAHFAAALATQPAIAASKLILWPVSMILLIPYPAVTMFYQHSLVPPGRPFKSLRSTIAECRRDALYRPRQVIWMLLLVILLRAILWINVFGLLLLAPLLWKTLTGLEGNLTRAPELLVNPTSLAMLSILAYIGLDPIVKAACVLRQYTRQSQSSGTDLRLSISMLGRAAAAVILCASCAPLGSSAANGQPATNSATVSPDRMRQAIESVFHDPHNAWDLPVVQAPRPRSDPFGDFVNSIVDRIDAVWKSITSALGSLIQALRHIFSNTSQPQDASAHPVSNVSGWLVIAIFTLLLAAAILFAWWNRRKRSPPQATAATAIPAPGIDVAREDMHANDHPEKEWLRLAQQHRMAGDLRLALRALYLSTLAAFGGAGLISLMRGKSNLDYLHELQRRGKRLNTEFVPLFHSNLSLFEESWYGDHRVTEETFEIFERNSSVLRKLL
jgi:hypothetical protein